VGGVRQWGCLAELVKAIAGCEAATAFG